MSPAARFRILAAGLFVGGGGMVASNVWQIRAEGRFSPSFFILGCALLVTTPIFVIVGRPTDPESGQPPFWWRFASGALGLVGAAIGAWLSFVVEH